MTDIHKKELQDFRDYRATFMSGVHGKRALANMMKVFFYNDIMIYKTEMDMAKHIGSMDVIKHILQTCGVADNTEAFVNVLSNTMVKGPEPYQETEADTE